MGLKTRSQTLHLLVEYVGFERTSRFPGQKLEVAEFGNDRADGDAHKIPQLEATISLSTPRS